MAHLSIQHGLGQWLIDMASSSLEIEPNDHQNSLAAVENCLKSLGPISDCNLSPLFC
jgi:hypothetical protein